MPDKARIQGVPTNVITGFLGVGKTTAILDLIRQKPDRERWAVLVNEFGEIGVDGRLFVGRASEESGVYVEEVPGGCMCCASELPMQIALNRLLRRSRPDRLLIEPTGLGHPAEVLQTLSKGFNRETLTLGRTLTLLDARNLSDERYTSHATFRQQLEIADSIIANKADLYADRDRAALQEFLTAHCHPLTDLVVTEQGRLSLDTLNGAPLRSYEPAAAQHAHTAPVLAADLPFPATGVVSAVNEGEGFSSVGWRFSPEKVFDRSRLLVFFRDLRAERMKGVFITEQGPFAYNMTRDGLEEIRLEECTESRVEIIANEAMPGWEAQILNCLRQS